MEANWKKIIKTVAPAIGTALDTPATGLVLKYVAERLLDNSNASEDEVLEYFMNANSDDLNRIRDLDSDFELEMKGLNIDVFALEVEDRISARRLFKVNQKPQVVLSIIFVTGFFIVLYYVTIGKLTIDPAVRDILMMLMGLLVREMTTIMQFWFGSSRGSQEKAESMINQINNLKD